MVDISSPWKQLSKRIRDRWQDLWTRIRVAANAATGQYTSATIDITWHRSPNRIDLINALIGQNGYQTYLEIGCRDDACFNAIKAEHKVGVDPCSGGTLRLTSDEFFSRNTEHFDLIFIDGLHLFGQVRKDISNAVRVLGQGGAILLHDCLPTCCLAQYRFPVVEMWNGDVWKAIVEVRTLPQLDTAVCMIDHGVGLIKNRQNAKPLSLKTSNFRGLKYSLLARDYRQLLNTITYQEALQFAGNR
jgi:hypothetical protein